MIYCGMSRTSATVLTQRGQTSVPAEVRHALDLQAGMRLTWEAVSEDEIRVRVIRGVEGDPVAMLGFANRFRNARSTAEWMAELREGER